MACLPRATTGLSSYRIYLHGNPVGYIDHAMTKGEAVTRFANLHYNRIEYGLMAVPIA